MKLPAMVRLTVRNVLVNTDPGTMFFMLGIPAFYLLVLGTMFQGLIPSFTQHGVTTSYTTFLAPGIVGMQAFTAGNIGGGMLWADRRWGMFEQLLVGPFRRADYLLGIMLVSVFFSLAGSGIMMALAFLINGDFNITILGAIILVAVLVLGSIFFTSLFLIISVLVRTMNAYQTITFLLFFMLDFASTAFYPVTPSTPLVLRVISTFNPLSYIVDVVRDCMLYGVSYSAWVGTGIITLLTVIFFYLSLVLYNNVRTGL